MGVRNVHLPGGWHLNARRVTGSNATIYAAAGLSCRRICGRTRPSPWIPPSGIDQRSTMTTTTRRRPRPITFRGHCSSPQEEEAEEEEEIPVEEYMPSGLSEEEAIPLIIQDSELVELSQWEGLGLQLHASAHDVVVVPPPPPPAPPAPAPPVGWGHAVWGPRRILLWCRSADGTTSHRSSKLRQRLQGCQWSPDRSPGTCRRAAGYHLTNDA
jgi:hypothetical protein